MSRPGTLPPSQANARPQPSSVDELHQMAAQTMLPPEEQQAAMEEEQRRQREEQQKQVIEQKKKMVADIKNVKENEKLDSQIQKELLDLKKIRDQVTATGAELSAGKASLSGAIDQASPRVSGQGLV